MSTILDKKYLDKFFKLYSKCSRLYSEILNLERYLVVSYYKADDNYIYPYEYIDFNLLFCHRIGLPDNSNNPILSPEFEVAKNKFFIDTYKNSYFDELSILHSIGKMIRNKKLDFRTCIDKVHITSLNNIYRTVLNIE